MGIDPEINHDPLRTAVRDKSATELLTAIHCEITLRQMQTLDQIIRYAIAILLMIPMTTAALLIAPISVNMGWRIVRYWMKLALRIFGISVEEKFDGSPGQLDHGGVIVGLAQQSLLEPTAGLAVWDRRVLSIWNIEYALIPFFGWMTVLLGWIIIRQRPAQAKRQLSKAVLYVRDGGLVFLSAEGKRSVDGELNPYKKGPVVLAIEAQASIHPVYIAGGRACLAVSEWKIRPGKIILHYLQPISTRGLTYDDRNILLERLEAIGHAAHARWRQDCQPGELPQEDRTNPA